MNKFFRFYLLPFFCTLILLSGCTYHSKIRRNLYKQPDMNEKINAKVMVVGDKFLPGAMMKEDENYWSTYQMRLRVDDGLSVAVADALGTLFTDVEVNYYKYRKNYDYIAEIEFKSGVDYDAEWFKMRWFDKNWHLRDVSTAYLLTPWLGSQLVVTIRNPKTKYVVAQYMEEDREYFKRTPLTEFSTFFSTITFGLFTPLEAQTHGRRMRKMTELQIRKMLRKIMAKMEEDRINYFPIHENEEKVMIRQDGKYEPFMNAVVYIESETRRGTGFFISSNGYIITNAHVVEQTKDAAIKLYTDKETDQKVRFAKVIKSNATRDLALLKIEGENYPWLELEIDPKSYITGEPVVAIGQSHGVYKWTTSQGIISKVASENGMLVVQTDATVLHGNSGGPLISKKTGKVIGVTSFGEFDTLNFAISGYEVQRTLKITQPLNEDDFESLLED